MKTLWDEKVKISDPQCCETLLSVVREFLTNVMKHSEGREVEIRSRYSNGHIELKLTDLAEYTGEFSYGNGLSGVEERIAAMDGRFLVEMSDNSELTWSISLPEASV